MTARTISALLGLYADNTSGAIDPSDGRDVIDTLTTRTREVRITDPEWGADPTGVTECSAAINSAAAAALSANVRLVGQGIFKIGNTVTFGDIDVDLGAATFNWNHAFPLGSETPCILVNRTTGNKQIAHRTIRLPRVNNSISGTATNGYWSEHGYSNDIGIQISGCNYCFIYVPQVTNFSSGLAVDGNNAVGTAYNTVFIGELTNNMINFRAYSIDAAGWSNANTYIGGSFTHFEGENSIRMSGTRHIKMIANPLLSDGVVANDNRFIGCAFETNVAEYYFEINGLDNVWIGCHWEIQGTTNPPQNLFADGTWCHNNRIIQGTGPDWPRIVNVQTNGAGGNGNPDGAFYAEVLTSQAVTSATATDAATVGPSVAVWANIGDIIEYIAIVDVQGDGTNNGRVYINDSKEGTTQQILQRSTNTFATMIPTINSSAGLAVGTTVPVLIWVAYPVTSANVHPIKLQYSSTSTGTVTVRNRKLWVRVTPGVTP